MDGKLIERNDWEVILKMLDEYKLMTPKTVQLLNTLHKFDQNFIKVSVFSNKARNNTSFSIRGRMDTFCINKTNFSILIQDNKLTFDWVILDKVTPFGFTYKQGGNEFIVTMEDVGFANCRFSPH